MMRAAGTLLLQVSRPVVQPGRSRGRNVAALTSERACPPAVVSCCLWASVPYSSRRAEYGMPGWTSRGIPTW
jgi:hypothetical protein